MTNQTLSRPRCRCGIRKLPYGTEGDPSHKAGSTAQGALYIKVGDLMGDPQTTPMFVTADF
jgi:hypothetical protein